MKGTVPLDYTKYFLKRWILRSDFKDSNADTVGRELQTVGPAKEKERLLTHVRSGTERQTTQPDQRHSGSSCGCQTGMVGNYKAKDYNYTLWCTLFSPRTAWNWKYKGWNLNHFSDTRIVKYTKLRNIYFYFLSTSAQCVVSSLRLRWPSWKLQAQTDGRCARD